MVNYRFIPPSAELVATIQGSGLRLRTHGPRLTAQVPYSQPPTSNLQPPTSRPCSAVSTPVPHRAVRSRRACCSRLPKRFRHGSNATATTWCRSICVGSIGCLARRGWWAKRLRRDAASRGVHVHIGIATSRTVAMAMALASPGLTVVPAGGEAAALARLPLTWLEQIDAYRPEGRVVGKNTTASGGVATAAGMVAVLSRWGLRTCGELAALPAADLSARTGRAGLIWQAIARGEDARPLVPTRPDERFDATLDLEWPIEGLEPLSFVLTRLLEPLSTRLERSDRGAAALHVSLRLVNRTEHARRLDIPAPMREVRALRTLALLDLEAHPPTPASIVSPSRSIRRQGVSSSTTLFARPHPTPEQLSTLVARLNALMGEGRVGAAVPVDSHRPGACAMKPFAIEQGEYTVESPTSDIAPRTPEVETASALVSALRRYRQPIVARVTVANGRPIRVTTDRVGWGGGAVMASAGPWRTSGAWWEAERDASLRDHRTGAPQCARHILGSRRMGRGTGRRRDVSHVPGSPH